MGEGGASTVEGFMGCCMLVWEARGEGRNEYPALGVDFFPGEVVM